MSVNEYLLWSGAIALWTVANYRIGYRDGFNARLTPPKRKRRR